MEALRRNGVTADLASSWQARARPSHPYLWDALLHVAFDHLQGAMRPDARVVDVGCGEGHITQVFSDQGCRVLGLDVHLPTLQGYRAADPTAGIVAGDAQQLPLPDASVDALFSFSTFQYVDRPRALGECSRVLKRGGRFAIVENLAANPVAKAYRAWHRMSGRRYPAHLSPRNHLSWEDRRLYESHFSTVRYETFHLLTPVLMPLSASGNASGRGDSASRRLVRAIDRLEQGFVRALPFTRAACWHVVVYGVR